MRWRLQALSRPSRRQPRRLVITASLSTCHHLVHLAYPMGKITERLWFVRQTQFSLQLTTEASFRNPHLTHALSLRPLCTRCPPVACLNQGFLHDSPHLVHRILLPDLPHLALVWTGNQRRAYHAIVAFQVSPIEHSLYPDRDPPLSVPPLSLSTDHARQTQH